MDTKVAIEVIVQPYQAAAVMFIVFGVGLLIGWFSAEASE